MSFAGWLKEHPILTNSYLSFLTSIAIACLITSYRKQEKMLGLVYPNAIEHAIRDQLHSLDFYKESVLFSILLAEVDNDWVRFVTELSYVVVNRTDSDKVWHLQYKFDRNTGRAQEIKFNEEPINLENPNLDVAIGIPKTIKAGQRAKVYFRVEERFRSRDSEFYTSYYPATDLKVVVHYEPSKTTVQPEQIRFYFDVLHFSDSGEVRGKHERAVHIKGILPYQGVRVNWRLPNDHETN